MSLCFLKGPLAIPFLWMSSKSVFLGSLSVKIASVGCTALLCSYKSINPRYPQIKGKPRNVKLLFSVPQLDLSLQRGNGNTYFSSIRKNSGNTQLLLIKAFIHRWGLWGFLPFFFPSFFSFLFFFHSVFRVLLFFAMVQQSPTKNYSHNHLKQSKYPDSMC